MKIINKFTKSIFISFFITLFTLLFVHLDSFAQNKSDLTILHINDTNGNLDPILYGNKDKNNEVETKAGGMARIAYFVKKFKEENPNTLFFAGSDILAPMPISSLSKGKISIKLLNNMPIDVWSPGNYDFLYGVEELQNRVNEANFPIINSNIYSKETNKPLFPPYTIIEKNNKKIAVLGVSKLSLYKNLKNNDILDKLIIKDPFEVVKQLSDELKEKADLIVLIGQLENKDKSEILLNTSVDLIIGSIGKMEESNLTSFSVSNGKFSVSTVGYTLGIGQVDLNFKDKIEVFNIKQHFLSSEDYPISELEKTVPKIVNTLEGYKNAFTYPEIAEFNENPSKIASYEFITNVMRYKTNSEATILDKTFFLRGASLQKV